jgi:hypothetical protein
MKYDTLIPCFVSSPDDHKAVGHGETYIRCNPCQCYRTPPHHCLPYCYHYAIKPYEEQTIVQTSMVTAHSPIRDSWKLANGTYSRSFPFYYICRDLL